MHFIVKIGLTPLRKSADFRSEMIGQMLFGELGEILQKKHNALNIRQLWDGLEGWVDARNVEIITDEDLVLYQKNPVHVLSFSEPLKAENFFMPLPVGAALPLFDGLQMRIGERFFSYSGKVIAEPQNMRSGELAARLARQFLFAPELVGGRSPFGMDAVFFPQLVYKMLDIALPADVFQMVNFGRIVHFMEETQPGDLAFFDDERGRINHVGIIVSDSEIVHTDACVRTDRIDHFGIFNEISGKYTHQLRVVKRLLPDRKREKSADLSKNEPEIETNQAVLFE